MPGATVGWYTLRRRVCATGVWQTGARDAAEYPTVHASLQTERGYVAPSIAKAHRETL